MPDFNRSINTSSVSGNEFSFESPPAKQSSGGAIVDAEIIPGGSDMIVPHVSTYSGIFNATNKTYYTYFDEALADSQQNALSMARDEYINELMYGRIYPVISLPHDIEVDDPEDQRQIQIAKEINSIVEHISKFNNMKKNLMRAVFYGKQASQIALGEKKILGRPRVTVVKHIPINGDKLRYSWRGTPGIAIYPGYRQRFMDKFGEDMVENTNLGPALFFKTPYLRNKFIIHNFEPSDTDYLFEINMSQAVHGLGLRSRYYWGWQKLMEVSQWFYEALERIGANGMLIGFFKSGNMAAKQAVWNALINIQRNNMCVFEVDPSYTGNYGDLLQRLDPSAVAYDVMFNAIVHLEEILRRGWLGQNLSSSSAPTGLGSGVAEFQETTRDNIVRADATDLAETLDDDLMPVILKNNYFEYEKKIYRGDDLPFGVRFRIQVDDGKIQERIDAAEKLVGMGVQLDSDDLRDQAGFSAPKSGSTTLMMPGMDQNVVPVAGQNGGGPSKNGKPAANGSNGKPKPKKPSNVDRNIFNATEDDMINHIGHYLRNSNAAKAAGVVGAAWNSAEQSVIVFVGDVNVANDTTLYYDLTSYLGRSKIEIRAVLDGDVYFKPNGYVFIDLDAYLDYRAERFQLTRDDLDNAIAAIDPAPSDAQKESGNYRKAHVSWNGLPITIETGKGQVRSGKDKNGKPWSVTMQHSYGYIKRTQSEADGDHIDVFLNHDGLHHNKHVYIIDQFKPEDGSFDEHKVMLGFDNHIDAKDAYLSNYSKDWKGYGGISEVPLDQFKEWINDGDTSKPYHAEHTQPVDRNAFLESDHPRHPKGTAEGGRFAPKDFGGSTALKDRKFGKTRTSNAYIEVRDVNKLSKDIFGKVVPIEDILTMAGLPDDAHCEILEDFGMLVVDSQIHGVASITRSFAKHGNSVYIHNDFLSVNKEKRGQGIALQVFGRQVEEAIEQGVSHIECFAARSDDPDNFLNGYEVWPKFGYDGYLSAYIKDKLSNISGDWVPRNNDAKVSDLYKTREGYEWWKKHGEAMMMTFDLTEGSYSRQTWDAYLAARESRAATKSISATTKENQSMMFGNEDGQMSRHDASTIDRESDPSVMISLWVPTNVAKRIAVPKGEPMSRLHITLAYLGRQSELGQEAIAAAYGVCQSIVDHCPPIQALLDGYGRFPATAHSDNKDVIYLKVDSDQLMTFRRQLCQILDMAGVPYKKNFEYTPHITLSYVRDYEKMPVDPGPIGVSFDTLSFSVGKDIEEFEFNKNMMDEVTNGEYTFVNT